jgi:hypothetical protein
VITRAYSFHLVRSGHGDLFVPKPTTEPGGQGRRTPNLGRGVHRCPLVDRTQIEGYWGVAKRLTLALPAITGQPSIETVKPDIWSTLQTLSSCGMTSATSTMSRATPRMDRALGLDCSPGFSCRPTRVHQCGPGNDRPLLAAVAIYGGAE